MPLHKDLTGSDLHEPKGVAGASADTVYVANGSGSGVWQKPEAENVTIADSGSRFTSSNVEGALAETYDNAAIILNTVLEDVSESSTILIPVPVSLEVQTIDFVLSNGITVADASLTITRSDGASMGSQTISYSGSSEGTSFSFTPSGNATLTYPTHRYIKIVSDGGSTTAASLFISVHCERP